MHEDEAEHGPRTLSMTTLMTPEMVNFSGKVHGGALLKLLDEVAYSCAARYSGHYVVTLLVDDVRFRAPVYVGELVSFMAAVNWVGRTSMEVGIRVVAENHRTRATRHVMSCFFVMVAIDDDGKSVPVARFEPEDDDARRRWAEAGERREIRQHAP